MTEYLGKNIIMSRFLYENQIVTLIYTVQVQLSGPAVKLAYNADHNYIAQGSGLYTADLLYKNVPGKIELSSIFMIAVWQYGFIANYSLYHGHKMVPVCLL